MNARGRLAVLGGGSWGTALAIQAARAGLEVNLWVHDPELAHAMEASRVNAKYLHGHTLPPGVGITASLEEAIEGAADVILAVPSHHCRRILELARPFVSRAMAITVASKGIENESLLRVSEVARDVLADRLSRSVAVISGPSFAQEVAMGHPTAVVAASPDADLARHLQGVLSAGGLRIYTSDDTTGVELGGALKNVIAIAAGAVEGLGYGSNTLAALITRGLAEMSRLSGALGGRSETLSGLAGLGDLVLTCTGRLSRNRSLGVAMGRGLTLQEHQSSTPMIAEGVRTALSAHRLAGRQGVEMPITAQVHAILYEGKPAADAVKDLLARQLRPEQP